MATEKVKAADPLEMKHLGFGRYEVAGQKFNTKLEAEKFVAAQKAQAEIDAEIGDVLPEGYDFKVADRTMVFRGSLMELAMNEVYTPSGEYNSYYDREWVWAWAGLDSRDIADKQAKGYKLVDLDTLQKGISEGKYPEHILSLVRAEGSYLVYGDSVLMRMPRVLWRQQQAAETERTMKFFGEIDKKQRAAFDNAGVGVKDLRITNELKISS